MMPHREFLVFSDSRGFDNRCSNESVRQRVDKVDLPEVHDTPPKFNITPEK